MFSPNYSDHVNNGSAYSELTGRDDFTLGSLRLDSLEVWTISHLENGGDKSARVQCCDTRAIFSHRLGWRFAFVRKTRVSAWHKFPPCRLAAM